MRGIVTCPRLSIGIGRYTMRYWRSYAGSGLPILLGGDHCLSIGSISAVARRCREEGRKLRVLWLDAHADFNTCELSPSGNIHGMPLACLCGFGPRELVTLAARCRQSRRPACGRSAFAVSMRVRSASSTSRGSTCSTCVMSMRWVCVRPWSTPWPGSTVRRICMSVSMSDFLDPDIAPGVGTTVPGGPTYREAQLCMEMIADTRRLGSLDIVELNPAFDVRNKTAALAVDLVESLFGKSTLVRRPVWRPAGQVKPESVAADVAL